MLFSVVFTIICFIFILIDLMPMYQSKSWRLFWIYTVTMVFGYILVILIGLGIKIPSPSEPLKMIITTIFGK